MRRTVKAIGLSFSLLALTVLFVVTVNQTSQIVDLAARLNPVFGRAVLWGLLGLYGILVLLPIILYLGLPKPLTPPASEQCPEFAGHVRRLKARLKRNPRLKDACLDTRQHLNAALQQLDQAANEVVTVNASSVFLTTAISQSGRLDALTVLAAQSKMVWQVARIYYQRPTLRDMVHLYGNVAATALVAGEIDEIDVEPMVTAIFGSAFGAVPGLQQLTSVLVKSVLTGSSNAFLTLRVGMIAKRYCAALVVADKRLLRRAAVVEATKLLGGIAANGTMRIAGAAGNAVKSRAKRMLWWRNSSGQAVEIG